MENEEYQNEDQEDQEHEEENAEELVTVFSTENLGIAAVAKSILEEAGINYNMKDEGIQGLTGVGLITGIGGLDQMAEPVEIQVLQEDAEKAVELLKDVEESEPLDQTLPPPELGDENIEGNENPDDDK